MQKLFKVDIVKKIYTTIYIAVDCVGVDFSPGEVTEILDDYKNALALPDTTSPQWEDRHDVELSLDDEEPSEVNFDGQKIAIMLEARPEGMFVK